MRNMIFVGHKGGKAEVFRADHIPTSESHGSQYAAVTGPFRTVRGAHFLAKHGNNNPHVLCVADAERIAKLK